MFQEGFPWFQVDLYDFHVSRLVFHGSRVIFIVFPDSRLVFMVIGRSISEQKAGGAK